jgi:hypothetical protein
VFRSTTSRMYRRVATDYPACYLENQSFRQGTVRDLSLNGFRVEGQPGVRCHDMVMLRVWLPGGHGSIDIDQAVVRWVKDLEFGVQIIALSNESDLRLALHVERELERTALHRLAG